MYRNLLHQKQPRVTSQNERRLSPLNTSPSPGLHRPPPPERNHLPEVLGCKAIFCRIWIYQLHIPRIRSCILHWEPVYSSDNKALIQLLFASCLPGYGSIASPAKEEKNANNKNDSPTKESPPSESTQEMVDGRKMFESWLFDKLTFITAMELQVKRCSILKVYGNVYCLVTIGLLYVYVFVDSQCLFSLWLRLATSRLRKCESERFSRRRKWGANTEYLIIKSSGNGLRESLTLAGSKVETLTFTHKLVLRQISNFGGLFNVERTTTIVPLFTWKCFSFHGLTCFYCY